MYIYYRKIGGRQKCISELDDKMYAVHRYNYFKTFVEAWHFLRKKHAVNGEPCVVHEWPGMFRCEVPDDLQLPPGVN